MKTVTKGSHNIFSAHCAVAAINLGVYTGDGFDQDQLSGRYGAKRYRLVQEKSRNARSKPRTKVGSR